MAGGLINEDYTDYTKAFCFFNKGKALVNEGTYEEGMDILRQSYNIVGRDGAKNMTILIAETTVTDGYLAEFHELMGRGYLGIKDYEHAIEHFKQWMEVVSAQYGRDSDKLAKCHLWLARTWKNINVYSINVDSSFQKNMEKPVYHYKAAYELLKSRNGDSVELSTLKKRNHTFFRLKGMYPPNDPFHLDVISIDSFVHHYPNHLGILMAQPDNDYSFHWCFSALAYH